MFQVQCPFCKSVLRVQQDTFIGQHEDCPVCQKQIRLTPCKKIAASQKKQTSHLKTVIIIIVSVMILGLIASAFIIYYTIKETKKEEERAYRQYQYEMQKIEYNRVRNEYNRKMRELQQMLERELNSYDYDDF